MSSETITKNDLANILGGITALDGKNMTEEEIDTFVDSLDVTSITAVDYIVDQGTSGIWTYRRWNSGVAECWGKFLHNTTVSGSWGNGFLSNVKIINFPTNLFISPPIISAYIDSTYVGVATNENQIVTKDLMRCYIFRTSSTGTTAANYYFHIEAKGRWK